MFGRKSPNDGASQATLERDENGTREEEPLELSEETRSVLDQFRQQWDQLDTEFRERQDQCIGDLIAHCERLQHRRREQAKTIDELKSDAAQLRKQWDELAVDAAQMREHRDEQVAEVEQLRKACNQSTAEVEQLRNERDEAVAEAERLRNEREGIAAEAEQLRNERREVGTEADQLRRKLETLIAKANRLRKERDQSAGDVDHLRRQREELVREVAQLTEERDLLAAELRSREDDFDSSPSLGSTQDDVSPASTHESIEPAEPAEYYPEDQVHELAGAMEEEGEQEHAEEIPPVAEVVEEDEDLEETPQTRSRVWDKLVAGNRQRSERAAVEAPAKASQSPQTRRAVPRCIQGARVTVIPDSGRNQIGIEGQLHRVTCTGASLILPQALKVDEYVVIEMVSANERTRVEVRAFVRQVDPLVDGSHLVGFALVTQLEYGEIQGLRSP